MAIVAVLTLVLGTLFAGAALYISLVEHPARLVLSEAALICHWRSSYARALPIQGALAITGGGAGVLAWSLLGNWAWLAGGMTLLANWPYTLLWIMPVNRQLHAWQPGDEGGCDLMLRWGRLHGVRSVLGAIATALFAIGAVASGGL